MSTNGHRQPSQKDPAVYKQYIHLDTLLELQFPGEEQLFPDELTFQVVHQTFELWWKVTLQLLQRAVVRLDQNLITDATVLIHRAAMIQHLLIQVMRHLEFLSPIDFLTILQGRGDGSGASSPGYHTVKRFAPQLWDAFQATIAQAQIPLAELYLSRDKEPALYRLAETMADFDESMYAFRASHVKLAQRFLGSQPMGPRGYTVPALEKRVPDMLFPELWEMRSQLPPLLLQKKAMS